jgi:hypothetical protein
VFGEAATGSDGGAASAGEIVAIGADDTFDDAKMAQTGELLLRPPLSPLTQHWMNSRTMKPLDIC